MKNPKKKLPVRKAPKRKKLAETSHSAPLYPFMGIVGQGEMKLGLILNVIDPLIGGVLIMGHRGTGKSTAVRGLAELLPEIAIVNGCPYRCDPLSFKTACEACRASLKPGKKIERERARVAVIELPLGATEDRVCGAIDIHRALADGVKAFEPGLLARANRGFLYIDEVNLLEDHLVDLLLDVAVTGENRVERENISVKHPARFVLIGSGNPEEGELRPQLLDRFGLSVEVRTENELDERMEVVERRDAYDRDPEGFVTRFAGEQEKLSKRITAAQKQVASIKVERSLLRKIAELCSDLQIDGHRGELTITRAARALAALEGKRKVGEVDVKRVAGMALRHRLRRDPLEETAEAERIQQALDRTFQDANTSKSRNSHNGSNGDGGGLGEQLVANEESRTESTSERRRVASANSPKADGGGKSSHSVNPFDHYDARLSQMQLPRQMPVDRPPLRSNGRDGANVLRNQLRGRYVRATAKRNEGARLAIDATLRSLVSSIGSTPRSIKRQISTDDFRFKELSCKTGRLFIFAIDTSGSMARHRIKQAKGAVLQLLKQSYVHRDQVAIVSFRGSVAAVDLPASRSILRARRVLDSLRIGGGTPLSAGLACALKLAKNSVGKVGEISVLLFTDGNANVPLNGFAGRRRERQVAIDKELSKLGAAFRKQRFGLTIVDTQTAFLHKGNAQSIAQQLSANYYVLPIGVTNPN